MGNEASTEEPKKTSAFMKKMRGIAASAVGLFASSTGSSNATDVNPSVEDNNSRVHEFTEASEEISKGGKTYNVETTRSISGDSYENVIVSTNTNEKEQKGRTKKYKTEYVVEGYNLTAGYHKKEDVKETAEKRRKSGILKYSEEENSSTLYTESGATDHTMGKEFTAESSNHYEEKIKYDRKGRYKKAESHKEIHSIGAGIRRDNIEKYNYNEDGSTRVGLGNSDNYEIKKAFSVSAKSENGVGQVDIISDKKQEKFLASIESNGHESYETLDKEHLTKISIKGKEKIGFEINIEDGAGRELSRRELKKELKIARMKANNVVRKVTKGEITSVGEYFASVAEAKVNGTMPKLGAIFDMSQKDLERVADEKEKLRAKHNAKVDEAKSVTAQDIVNQKLAER